MPPVAAVAAISTTPARLSPRQSRRPAPTATPSPTVTEQATIATGTTIATGNAGLRAIGPRTAGPATPSNPQQCGPRAAGCAGRARATCPSTADAAGAA